jgi:CRP/FNR family transcriptional regulator, cyclic AMP receptor protein
MIVAMAGNPPKIDRARSIWSVAVKLDAAKAIIVRRGWLSKVAPAFQHAVIDRCHLQSICAGNVLYRLGDPAGGMFGVVSGAVALEVAPVEAGPHLSSLMLSGT